jgi:hypothetical protein
MNIEKTKLDIIKNSLIAVLESEIIVEDKH